MGHSVCLEGMVPYQVGSFSGYHPSDKNWIRFRYSRKLGSTDKPDIVQDPELNNRITERGKLVVVYKVSEEFRERERDNWLLRIYKPISP